MTKLLEWLCDLDRIRLAQDQPLMLEWHTPFARWALFGLAFLAVLLVALTYRHEPGGVGRRVLLAGLRGAALAVVLAMICQPVLVFQRDRVERARVYVLLDASASMQQADPNLDPEPDDAQPPDADAPSRLTLAQRALLADNAAALHALASANDVTVAEFSSTVQPVARIDRGEGVAEAADAVGGVVPDGVETRVCAAVKDVLERQASARLAAVVVLSDGQDTSGAGLAEAVEAARARRVPIHVVPVGSAQQRPDVRVTAPLADGNVFTGDLATVRTQLSATGLSEPRDVDLRLVDERSGETLAAETITLSPDRPTTDVEWTVPAAEPGAWSLHVQAGPDGDESETKNNVARSVLTVVGDRLRVLYVEGYPRFEYRYLKNALVREPSVRLSCLLLSADADFAQEGAEPIRRFPETPEELAEFDVVILGDVNPQGDWIGEAQMRMLSDFVASGGGLAIIAGERHVPQACRATPLEALLPVRLDPAFLGAYRTRLTTGFHPQLTLAGRQSRFFRFRRSRAESAALFDSLPPLFWLAQTLGPKPGAETLLEHPTLQSGAGPAPVAVIGRFGAGQTYFQATDDLWRWRRHTGELIVDSYWVQMVRGLAQPQRVAEDRRYALRPARSECRYGERVDVRLQVFDPQLLALLGERTELAVRDDGGFVVQRLPLDAVGEASNEYEGVLVASPVGVLTLRADDIPPLPGAAPPSAALQVAQADLEQVRPFADPDLLARLAEGSGGRIVPLDQLAAAFAQIEDRSVRIPDDVQEPLWDTKLALLLFIVFVGLEWVLRKLYGML